MAKFRKEFDEVKARSFLAADEQRRKANSAFADPYLRCPVCGYTVRQSYAEEHNIQKCPNCGSEKPAILQNLPYDPAVQSRPTPSVHEALATERANRVRRVT